MEGLMGAQPQPQQQDNSLFNYMPSPEEEQQMLEKLQIDPEMYKQYKQSKLRETLQGVQQKIIESGKSEEEIMRGLMNMIQPQPQSSQATSVRG